jgi:hypothetical protein
MLLGETVQLPLPCGGAQVKFTVPLNPSCAVIFKVSLMLAPDFTVAKEFALSTKSGFSVTFKVNAWVFAAGAPLLVA